MIRLEIDDEPAYDAHIKNDADDTLKKSEHIQPPMRHGVSASQVFLPKLDPKANAIHTIYAFLCQQFPHISAQEWRERFDNQLIFDAQNQVLNVNTPYQPEQHIYYYRQLSHEINVPFAHEILFENEHLLVVDKPHFLTVSPTGQYVQQTLLTRLKQHSNNAGLTPIHRLDRETAGIILFSKVPETRHRYQQLFAERKVQKTYHAIAPFHPDIHFPCEVKAHLAKGEPFYTMQILADQAENSCTLIDILEKDDEWAKYQLKPITGKQHQLRVHMHSLGLPLKNDPLYPIVKHSDKADFSQPLQLLAKRIEFIDPISHEKMMFESKRDLSL
ncbi:tRNA pseudouridine32 synthase / 23S rRNA pseudouridine746 synthase [Acinetobacter marinus]|uniref:tRNA pseudouridine32 synthase / 23S rRNA pseudouridine746 synthase n=2 Tax=Acinetobacter marinus TaxID=281375 RepID=A0A1G6GS65_9GAMM|nr:tRNA pseudouridine32 synthase / 23S rRNA pseudouridine746 synthase [Acinetobacter marinus]